MSVILGIETSCDETAAAVVKDGREVLSSIVSSQISHTEFGGVVPELAAREHLSAIDCVTKAALSQAEVKLSDLDAVAVTNGPGLVPALLVGMNFARAMSYSNKIPLIPVNHFVAHIFGAFLENKIEILGDKNNYPLIALIVSGGHTALLLIDSDANARLIGQSLDDAAGEAFDKGAKILSLPYPGGPSIQKAAQGGNTAKFAFPRALTGTSGRAVGEENRFNFSFSGLKTALLNHVRNNCSSLAERDFLRDSAASYQEAIADVLLKKTADAAEFFRTNTIVLCGGVACNIRIREKFSSAFKKQNLVIADPRFCTDNAAMIAAAAFYSEAKGPNYQCDVFSRISTLGKIDFVQKLIKK